MNLGVGSVPTELIILIVAVVISGLVLTWLLRVVKATLTTALAIAAIALGLQLLFGIGPDQLWQQLQQLPQQLWELWQQRPVPS